MPSACWRIRRRRRHGGNRRSSGGTLVKQDSVDLQIIGFLRPGQGADDAFFAQGGKTIASFEHAQMIQIIDVATKQAVWQYGELGKPGSALEYLNFPDDAYMLPNGDVTVADIRNCRILEIAPDKHIVRQAGETGRCGSRAPDPLTCPTATSPPSHVLITTIDDHSLAGAR